MADDTLAYTIAKIETSRATRQQQSVVSLNSFFDVPLFAIAYHFRLST